MKELILTETRCKKLESLRLAIEIFTGQRVRLKNFDFNTDRGHVYTGEETNQVAVIFHSETAISFYLGTDATSGHWHHARFEAEKARVIREFGKYDQSEDELMWMVGRSATDRWEEPLFKK